MVPLFDFAAKVIAFKPPSAAKCFTDGLALATSIICSSMTNVRAVDASGNSKVMIKRPSSSVGINPVGFTLNIPTVATKIQINTITTSGAFLMQYFTPSEYEAVTRANQLLNR